MIRIQANVTINRPIDEVFRFMTNHQNALQWQSGLLEARVTNDVVGVGKTWVDVVQFLGRRLEIASELTEFEPLRAVGFKSTSGPIPLEEAVPIAREVASALEAAPLAYARVRFGRFTPFA